MISQRLPIFRFYSTRWDAVAYIRTKKRLLYIYSTSSYITIAKNQEETKSHIRLLLKRVVQSDVRYGTTHASRHPTTFTVSGERARRSKQTASNRVHHPERSNDCRLGVIAQLLDREWSTVKLATQLDPRLAVSSDIPTGSGIQNPGRVYVRLRPMTRACTRGARFTGETR